MREHAKTGKMGQKWGLVRKAIKNYFFLRGAPVFLPALLPVQRFVDCEGDFKAI